MTKPIEFWLSYNGGEGWSAHDSDDITHYDYHVIEYSALEKANARIEKLKAALSFYAEQGSLLGGKIARETLKEDDEAAK